MSYSNYSRRSNNLSVSRESLSSRNSSFIIPLPNRRLHLSSNSEKTKENDEMSYSSEFNRIVLPIPPNPPIYPTNYPKSRQLSIHTSANTSTKSFEDKSMASSNPSYYYPLSTISLFLLIL